MGQIKNDSVSHNTESSVQRSEQGVVFVLSTLTKTPLHTRRHMVSNRYHQRDCVLASHRSIMKRSQCSIANSLLRTTSNFQLPLVMRRRYPATPKKIIFMHQLNYSLTQIKLHTPHRAFVSHKIRHVNMGSLEKISHEIHFAGFTRSKADTLISCPTVMYRMPTGRDASRPVAGINGKMDVGNICKSG